MLRDEDEIANIQRGGANIQREYTDDDTKSDTFLIAIIISCAHRPFDSSRKYNGKCFIKIHPIRWRPNDTVAGEAVKYSVNSNRPIDVICTSIKRTMP